MTLPRKLIISSCHIDNSNSRMNPLSSPTQRNVAASLYKDPRLSLGYCKHFFPLFSVELRDVSHCGLSHGFYILGAYTNVYGTDSLFVPPLRLPSPPPLIHLLHHSGMLYFRALLHHSKHLQLTAPLLHASGAFILSIYLASLPEPVLSSVLFKAGV